MPGVRVARSRSGIKKVQWAENNPPNLASPDSGTCVCVGEGGGEQDSWKTWPQPGTINDDGQSEDDNTGVAAGKTRFSS